MTLQAQQALSNLNRWFRSIEGAPSSVFAVCCSVLQCVAVCCSVLQCVAVSCSVAECCSVLQKWHSRCNRRSQIWIVDFVLLKGPLPVCCSVLQCVAVCCSVLQCDAGAIGILKSHSFISFYGRVTYEWVVSHMNESCLTCMSDVTYRWVTSHMNESWPVFRSIRSITKCVTVCCSVLQCDASFYNKGAPSTLWLISFYRTKVTHIHSSWRIHVFCDSYIHFFVL